MSEELSASPSCDDVLSYLYLYLDKEIEPSERAHVQQHLDECIPCLEAFEFEAELKTVIKSRCKDEVPTHLVDKIRTSLRVEIEAQQQGGTNSPS